MSSKFQKVIIILDFPIFYLRFWFLYKITFPLWLIFKKCVKGHKSCMQWYIRAIHISQSLWKSPMFPYSGDMYQKPTMVFPILSFFRRLHLYFWTMCIWFYFYDRRTHFRAMFQVNVKCWYLLEMVQFDFLSYGHICVFANNWPYIWTCIT